MAKGKYVIRPIGDVAFSVAREAEREDKQKKLDQFTAEQEVAFDRLVIDQEVENTTTRKRGRIVEIRSRGVVVDFGGKDRIMIVNPVVLAPVL